MSPAAETPLVVSSDEIVGASRREYRPDAISRSTPTAPSGAVTSAIDTFKCCSPKRAFARQRSPRFARGRERYQRGRAGRGPRTRRAFSTKRSEQGTYPEERAFAMMAWAFAGYCRRGSARVRCPGGRAGVASRIACMVRSCRCSRGPKSPPGTPLRGLGVAASSWCEPRSTPRSRRSRRVRACRRP